MNLCEILRNSNILLNVKSKTQDDVIQELLLHMKKMGHLADTQILLDNLKAFEKVQSTATGRGVAYPHAISSEIDELTILFGISPTGIDYNSPDGQLCHFVLLTLSPKNEPNSHRKFISKFRSMINDGDIRTRLLDASNEKSIFNTISQWEVKEASSEDIE